jgi:hypothetical protein
MSLEVNFKKLLIAFILLLYILYTCSLFLLSRGYYSIEDLFGPLSKSSYIATSLILFLVCALTYNYVEKDSDNPNYISLLIIILVILNMFLAPDMADSYYDQNFYDAGGHMIRGAFVTLAGHSDPDIDGYFDLQPAFFWVTAIFINIVYGSPTSPSDPIFGFFVKWFNIIATMIYIPILYLSFKKYGLKKGEAYLTFFLFFSLNFGRFHYAAQTYGNALFWLLLALVPDIIGHYDIRKILTLLPALTSLVFIHEGLTVFAIVALASILIALILPRVSRNSMQNVLLLLLYLLIIWFLFLLYVSKFTLPNFISTLISVVKVFLVEGATGVVKKGVSRAWQPWANVVFFKAVFMGLIILMAAFSSLMLYLKLKDKIYKVRMFVIFGITGFLGLIAAGLGGAGYIERIPLVLLPLIAITLVESMSRGRFSSNHKKVIATIALCLVIMEPFAFFSGRNFQSIPTSEDKAGEFLIIHTQSIARFYPEIRIPSAFTPLLTNSTPTHDTMYALYQHDFIQTLYYIIGNITTLNNYIYRLESTCNIIYSNPTAQLLRC